MGILSNLSLKKKISGGLMVLLALVAIALASTSRNLAEQGTMLKESVAYFKTDIWQSNYKSLT